MKAFISVSKLFFCIAPPFGFCIPLLTHVALRAPYSKMRSERDQVEGNSDEGTICAGPLQVRSDADKCICDLCLIQKFGYAGSERSQLATFPARSRERLGDCTQLQSDRLPRIHSSCFSYSFIQSLVILRLLWQGRLTGQYKSSLMSKFYPFNGMRTRRKRNCG